MGSIEPLFLRAAFKNTMPRKRSAYTTLTMTGATHFSFNSNNNARVSTPV